MGLRGPAPTPTAVRAARGGPNRTASVDEPQPESGMPTRPEGLSPDACAVWDAVASVVAPGVISRDNGQALSRYCHMLVRWWALVKWLDANDEVYRVVDQQSNVRWLRHPNLISYERLTKDLLRQEQEFGLTPSSRTRINAATSPRREPPKPAGPPVMRIAQ